MGEFSRDLRHRLPIIKYPYREADEGYEKLTFGFFFRFFGAD
jgi:hypothetical protein